jgi:hypothetical protein
MPSAQCPGVVFLLRSYNKFLSLSDGRILPPRRERNWPLENEMVRVETRVSFSYSFKFGVHRVCAGRTFIRDEGVPVPDVDSTELLQGP